MEIDPWTAFGIGAETLRLAEDAEKATAAERTRLERIRAANQLRVLKALQDARLSEASFAGSTGYGYGDLGREQIEQAYAQVFGMEKALVRVQIASGTQALALCLQALLRPGDELLCLTGTPYDTLLPVIGIDASGNPAPTLTPQGALSEYGIGCRLFNWPDDDEVDMAAVESSVRPSTKVVLIQKSRGYRARKSLTGPRLARLCAALRAAERRFGTRLTILVDNCYGEFVETREPGHLGADLCAGSLIKNPGGSLCASGGYVAGKAELVRQVAARLSAPGLDDHVGPTLGFTRQIAQGFFLAPLIVSECLKGMVFASAFFTAAGWPCDPGAAEERGDIVQSIEFGSPERLIAFCQAIQAAAPVDSFVSPEPWDMPGYADPVVMAAGAFVQGASIELSADGPMRPPYRAYLQGGPSYDQIRLACILAAERLAAVRT